MPRYPRIASDNLFYHIYSRGVEKRKIFIDTRDYQKFLDYLIKYKRQFDWIIYCYCLMPNHFHLLVQSQHDKLGQIMRSMLTAYSVYFNMKYKRVGPLFSGRYKSIICQDDAYLLQVSKYIHLNPVKAHLSSKPSDYDFSSYREYMKVHTFGHEKSIIDKRAMKRIVGEKL